MFRVLLLVCLALIGCSGEYEVRLQVVPVALLDEASSAVVAVVASCEGELDEGVVLGEPLIRFTPGDTAPALGAAETGPRGLYARLVDDSCQVIASGCSPVSLSAGGSDILRVIVRESTGNACSAGESCVAGECVDGDAGVGRDAGADAAPADVGIDAPLDAPHMDAPVPFDAGPFVTDTTCWRRPSTCDWSGSGFSLEQAPSGVIATLPRGVSNATYSPDGCKLIFSSGSDIFFIERDEAEAPFGDPVEMSELNTPLREDKAVFAPGELETFFTRAVESGDVFVHRATRSATSMPFSDIQIASSLNRVGFHSFDISLSGDGLRLYMARPRNALSSQDILVATRASRFAEFGEPVLVDEVSDFELAQAEPSPSADGRTLLVATRLEGDVNLRVYYSVRDSITAPWGALHPPPGPFFSDADEDEGAISPDGCEVLVNRNGVSSLLYYEPL